MVALLGEDGGRCKILAGRHRLRDPNRPAFSHPSPQGLGKNLCCAYAAVSPLRMNS